MGLTDACEWEMCKRASEPIFQLSGCVCEPGKIVTTHIVAPILVVLTPILQALRAWRIASLLPRRRFDLVRAARMV